MTAAETMVIDQFVDTDRYPLDCRGSDRWRSVVSDARRELRTDGVTVLTDFIRPELAGKLRRECADIAPLAYYDVETVNVYNTDPDQSLTDGHPARIAMERGNAFVARDRIPVTAMIQRLYGDPLFRQLIADCFELPAVHELSDPLAGLCLNVVTPGRSHPWHFDTNEFAVSMLTQVPESGGVFEYCPNIRTAESENLDDVGSVIEGKRDELIRRITLKPGDLQLFKGRYSLHRVNTVGGDRERHTAIFAYSQRPGVVGSVTRTQQLFGRVADAHLAAAGRAVRVDRLMD